MKLKRRRRYAPYIVECHRLVHSRILVPRGPGIKTFAPIMNEGKVRTAGMGGDVRSKF